MFLLLPSALATLTVGQHGFVSWFAGFLHGCMARFMDLDEARRAILPFPIVMANLLIVFSFVSIGLGGYGCVFLILSLSLVPWPKHIWPWRDSPFDHTHARTFRSFKSPCGQSVPAQACRPSQ